MQTEHHWTMLKGHSVDPFYFVGSRNVKFPIYIIKFDIRPCFSNSQEKVVFGVVHNYFKKKAL